MSCNSDVEPFKVYVRIRPFLDKEMSQLTQLSNEDPINNKNLTLYKMHNEH